MVIEGVFQCRVELKSITTESKSLSLPFSSGQRLPVDTEYGLDGVPALRVTAGLLRTTMVKTVY